MKYLFILYIFISTSAWSIGQRVEGPINQEVISEFLNIDITTEAKYVCELKDRADDVEKGKLVLWERIGKKYYALLMSDFLVLTKNNQREAHQVLVSFSDFQKEFGRWFKKIEREVSCPKVAN